MTLITRVFRPSQTVGQVYAKVYGSAAPRVPVGNVLKLEISHEEEVKKQPNMTALGGGNYAQTRRISAVNIAMDIADWNATNFTRSTFGTAALIAEGTVTDEPVTGYKGGLIRLKHPSPSEVTLKKVLVEIAAAGNYQVRPEGIFVLEGAAGIVDADALLASYTYPEYVSIEALTQSSPEIELSFGGLNEADNGKPMIIDIWRIGMGIAKTLALIQADFGLLSVEGEALADPTRVGDGLSKFYRAQMA